MNTTPYGHFSDEELLRQVYQTKTLCSSLELELAARLEQALDELYSTTPNLEDVLAQAEPAHP